MSRSNLLLFLLEAKTDLRLEKIICQVYGLQIGYGSEVGKNVFNSSIFEFIFYYLFMLVTFFVLFI